MVYILRYVTDESNYIPQEKGTMDSRKRNLFRNTALHSFTLRGENNKGMQGLMNHMQNLLNNLFGKMEHVKEVCEKLALSFLQCLILYYY